jgi:hypothetical protein
MRAAGIALLVALGLGCAFTRVQPVDPGDRERSGIRYYDPQPLLVVTCETTQIVYVPDRSRGYTVRPQALFAKNDFSIELSDGMLTGMDADMDSAGLLTLLQSVASEALGAAAGAAAAESALAPIPGMTGIWRFDYDETGTVSGLTRIAEAKPCP